MNGTSSRNLYALASAKAKEIEDELRRMNRWQADPLREIH
jgi:hypothetical protein